MAATLCLWLPLGGSSPSSRQLTYPLIAAPPFDTGAAHDTVAEPGPAMAVPIVGDHRDGRVEQN